ncbi:MAG TPA: cyclic nucleotide-binding domain-containing protein [Acidimicrobiales bacterium]|jgi:CRP-like cAMP-binding protein
MPIRFLKRDKIQLLSRLPLFETSSQRELAKVANVSVQAHKPAGSILTREGREGGLLFIILDGEAEIVRDGQLLGTLKEGDVVGELSLIDGYPRSASVRAVTDVEVLQIPASDFQAVIQGSPKLVISLLEGLARRIRDMDERWPAEL